MTITMTETLSFIGELPSAIEIAKIQEAAAVRLRAIDKEASAALVAGSKARINETLRPAFLRGLTGTVQERNRTGSRAGFLLDEESTLILRRDPRNRRYLIPEDVTRYRIPGSGIPVDCLDAQDD
ncbi:hypothetical protein [Streptomyces parvulus]